MRWVSEALRQCLEWQGTGDYEEPGSASHTLGRAAENLPCGAQSQRCISPASRAPEAGVRFSAPLPGVLARSADECYCRTAAMTTLDDFRRENKTLLGVWKLACVSEPFCQGPLMCTAAARIVSVPLYIRSESRKELTGPEKLAGVFRAALPGAPGSTLLQRISLL